MSDDERPRARARPWVTAAWAIGSCLVLFYALALLGPVGPQELALWLAASVVIVSAVMWRATRARRVDR